MAGKEVDLDALVERLKKADRKLPKLHSCMTKKSLEDFRAKLIYQTEFLEPAALRRQKQPLEECIILELEEAGYVESAAFVRDLIEDNVALLAKDEIGIVVDIRKKPDYLEYLASEMKEAELAKEKGNAKGEIEVLLKMAVLFSGEGKGILWLAEKLFLLAIALANRYLLDGGCLAAICKFYYGKFLLEYFPDEDTSQPFTILQEVRDMSNGKSWLLTDYASKKPDEPTDTQSTQPKTVFVESSLQLHRILLNNAKECRRADPRKAERLSTIAERRAIDAKNQVKQAEALIEVGISQLCTNDLMNALRCFEKALAIQEQYGSYQGICHARMHVASAFQRLTDYEAAIQHLVSAGRLAMRFQLNKELGQALHLLGELDLFRGKPASASNNLVEAFFCFMGEARQFNLYSEADDGVSDIDLDADGSHRCIFVSKNTHQNLMNEAEQSRLMMGVSAGQEIIAAYFDLLREAHECNVARHKVLIWDLQKLAWWLINKRHLETIPCLCKQHNRSPLDIVKIIQSYEIDLDEELNSEPSYMGNLNSWPIEDQPSTKTLKSATSKSRSFAAGMRSKSKI